MAAPRTMRTILFIGLVVVISGCELESGKDSHQDISGLGEKRVIVLCDKDGLCERPETADNCVDCIDSVICGDGWCEGSETFFNCPEDCKPKCGNDICEAGETDISCPDDCVVCGNGVCQIGETVTSCPADCLDPPSTPSMVRLPCEDDGAGNYTLRWNSTTGGVDRYIVYEYSGVSIPHKFIVTSNHKAFTSHPSGTFYYEIVACNTGGCSNPATSSTITVGAGPPAPPNNLSLPATADRNGNFTFTWRSPSSCVDFVIKEYGGDVVKNFYTTTTRYNFINHNDGTFYYHVRACNNAGCSSDAVSPTIEVAKYLVLGEACDPTEGTPCASDVCADLGDGRFICCDRACDVEAGSCQLCGLDGVCGVQASGHECRPVAGDCDTADYCDGVSQACGDEVLPTIAVCRPAADACDAAERCDGVSASCPVEDRRLPIGTVCRRSRGACDSPEYCEGNPTSCTADVLYPVGFTCREAAGPNDIPEACDGTPDCPPENPNGRSPEFVCGVTL